MALSVDSTFRDRCAYKLWNLAYASLTTYQQALINDEGAQVLVQLQYYANYFSMATGGVVAPDAWLPWFVSETVANVAATSHPDPARLRAFRQVRDETKAQQITTYARKLVDYNPSSDTEAFTYTFQALRYHIINHTIRQKPMLFPAIESVDAAIDWALKWVWNKGSWTYRRREIEFDITASETVSMTFSGSEVFDSFTSRSIYFVDSPNTGSRIDWADADTMADAKVRDGSDTGVPTLFRVESSGDTYTWFFSPIPDQTYTVRAEVLVRAPANPTSGTDTTPFSKFTADHMPHLRDLALAKVMYDHDSIKYAGMFREVCARIDSEFANYQDIGEPDNQQATRDVYLDWDALPTATIFGTGQ